MNPNPYLRGGATPASHNNNPNPNSNPNPYLRGGTTPSTSLGSGGGGGGGTQRSTQPQKNARRRAPKNPDDATYRPPPRTASSEDEDAYYEYEYGYATPATPEPATPAAAAAAGRNARRAGSGSGLGGGGGGRRRNNRRRAADDGDGAYRPPSADSEEEEEEGLVDRAAPRRRRGAAAGGKVRLRVKEEGVPRPSGDAAAGPATPAASYGVTPPTTPRSAASSSASPAAAYDDGEEDEEEEEESSDEGYDDDGYDEDSGYEAEPHPDLASLSQGPSDSWLSWPSWDFVGGESRSLANLAADGWYPTRTRFDQPWRKAEYETEWYEAVYWNLFVRVREFVKEYFGGGDIPGVPVVPPVGGGDGCGERGFPWLEGEFSKEFMWFVEKVAIQDNNVGGWDALLRRGVMRECLVTGIIAKLLETSVFDELLFGADQTQKTMLESQDECTLQYEGEWSLVSVVSLWILVHILTRRRLPAHHPSCSVHPHSPDRRDLDRRILALRRPARVPDHIAASAAIAPHGQALPR
jgi:hypothetical protein